ncbi:LacI family DNA-binding transcriptional regulator [Propioniciclava coleopterorum]|uniref:LacI family DNA-binding transcriptional regulator n=1 Tax=Propioniciclava coleopterorum TaxID=2714937 RepID=UPI001FEAAC38|nr:LacI family DNA-binding transcriptional regulator [Propioniciclava coleopterorum]
MAEPEKRPTIHDVARHAGVSSATVSRVLNGKKWVGTETQAAVQRAIARTGYTTNRSARSLAGGRSRSYAFLITQPQRALFEDPNYAELIRGASEELSERDLAMVIMIADTRASGARPWSTWAAATSTASCCSRRTRATRCWSNSSTPGCRWCATAACRAGATG